MKKYILIEIDEDLKNKFSSTCHIHKVKPMGLLIVFISMFVNNDLDRNKFIENYQEYKNLINIKKRELLKENRITGDLAHRLNKSRKK